MFSPRVLQVVGTQIKALQFAELSQEVLHWFQMSYVISDIGNPQLDIGDLRHETKSCQEAAILIYIVS